MILSALGMLLLTTVPADGTYLANVLPALVLTSLGMGAVFVPLTLIATTGLANEDQGLASGLFNTSQQVGGALGLAILASIANSRTDSLMADAGGAASALPNALTEGFQIAFLVGAGFAVLGAVLAATLISSRESREHAEAAQRGDTAPAPVAA